MPLNKCEDCNTLFTDPLMQTHCIKCSQIRNSRSVCTICKDDIEYKDPLLKSEEDGTFICHECYLKQNICFICETRLGPKVDCDIVDNKTYCRECFSKAKKENDPDTTEQILEKILIEIKEIKKIVTPIEFKK